MFNEAPELHPHVPNHFPKCENYSMSDAEYDMYNDVPYGQKPREGNEAEEDKEEGDGTKDDTVTHMRPIANDGE